MLLPCLLRSKQTNHAGYKIKQFYNVPKTKKRHDISQNINSIECNSNILLIIYLHSFTELIFSIRLI